MDENTYCAGAKPAIERIRWQFEQSRTRVNVDVTTPKRIVDTLDNEDKAAANDNQRAGMPDCTLRYVEEAIERCARYAEMRRRARRERQARRRAEAKLAASARTSGEA